MGQALVKTQFAISFLKHVFNASALIIKVPDRVRFGDFSQNVGIVFDDTNWNDSNMDREKMLHLVSGETDTIINIKHSSFFIPSHIHRVITNNYSLLDTFVCQTEQMNGDGLLHQNRTIPIVLRFSIPLF